MNFNIDFSRTVRLPLKYFQMNIESTMSVIMAYYNSCLALWEPLIEPIEEIKNEKLISTPWELKVKVMYLNF